MTNAKAVKTSDLGIMRNLGRNERVELKRLGVRGYYLSGPKAEVVEYLDGHLEPVIVNLTKLLTAVFLHILNLGGSMSSEQFRFVRRYLKLTQEDAGRLLGVARETINRYETGSDHISPAISDALRLHGLRTIMEPAAKKSGKTAKTFQPGALLDRMIANMEKSKSQYEDCDLNLIADPC